VLAGLGSRRGVEEINRENHLDLSGRSRVVELFCENGDD
jgi:hypothetical protein